MKHGQMNMVKISATLQIYIVNKSLLTEYAKQMSCKKGSKKKCSFIPHLVAIELLLILVYPYNCFLKLCLIRRLTTTITYLPLAKYWPRVVLIGKK